MILNKIIIHELKKESESKKVDLILSEELIPISDESTALVTALSDSFKSDRILYAIFDDSEGKYFPEKFTYYRTSTRATKDFISFTRLVIGNLVELITSVAQANAFTLSPVYKYTRASNALTA